MLIYIKNRFLIFQIPLWNISRFIFRQLRMTFFIKLWFFFNTICQIAKQFLNVKMINLEKKINRESASPPPPFKKTCPFTVLSPLFLIFQIPPLREVIKLYSPPPIRKKGVCEGVGFSEL